MTRREWLVICAAGAVKAAAPPPVVLAAQTYTVRGPLRREPTRTVEAMAAMGIKDVDCHSRTVLRNTLPQFKQHNIAPRLCAIETPVVTKNWEAFPDIIQVSPEEAIASMAEAGVEYCVLDYIPEGARGDGDDFFRRTADRMNDTGAACWKAGMKFIWRNHAFEFAGHPRPIDIYKERLDAKLVGWEMDLFWLSVVGGDAARLLKDWKGRVPVLRYNDRAKGLKPQYDESLLPGAWVEAGTGVVDFKPAVQAGTAAGARIVSTGRDEPGEGDPLDGLRQVWNYSKSAL
jgi:sugar phosphate isomerase/epimerase